MSMRDLDNVVKAYNKRKQRELEERFLVAAASTTEIVNILGAAFSSKKSPWKPIAATDMFAAWTERKQNPAKDLDYVQEVINTINERQAKFAFKGKRK